MKKVLIIGSKGMAGHLIYYQLKKSAAFNVIDIARDDAYFEPVHKLDVTQFDKLHLILKNEKPDIVINCVGVLNLDAEGDPGKAILLNSYLPHFLAREGSKTGFKLIHISTDCVFSGNKGGYRESDVADGIGFYAQSKALGEIKSSNHLTIRTSIVGPELRKNGIGLFHWFMNQNEKATGYMSTIWSGVTTFQLSKAVIYCMDNTISGLYHLTNGNSISKHDLLLLFKKYTNKNIDIVPVEGVVSDKSIIDTRKEFNYEIPPYEKMVSEMMNHIKQNQNLYRDYNIS